MKQPKELPELILGDGSQSNASKLSRLQAKGIIRKIYQKVYTSNLEDPLELIVKRHAHHIAGHICPRGVLSHRTAFEGGIAKNSILVITENSERTIKLPGLTIKVTKGPGASEEDLSHIGNLKMSSFPRMLLENLQITRDKGGVRKTVSKETIESKLDQICSINGEDESNEIRDQAKSIGSKLGMDREFKKLDTLIGSLLGTRASNSLATPSGIARAKGQAYDTARIDLFDTLCEALIRTNPLPIEDPIGPSDNAPRLNRAFFESYFSNYIEGTQFILSDAEDIVFKKTSYETRPQDSHDILATFELASAPESEYPSPLNPEEFLSSLKATHSTLMHSRTEVSPGKFKLKMNQAGATQFVSPHLVKGTLIQAFERAAQLSNPLSKALFLMFVVSEVHPFNDGNGRAARLVMNSYLSNNRLCRIIIPTHRRVDYIQSLKAMSIGKPVPFVGFMTKMHQETSRLSFQTIESATAQYRAIDAFEEYPEGFSMH